MGGALQKLRLRDYKLFNDTRTLTRFYWFVNGLILDVIRRTIRRVTWTKKRPRIIQYVGALRRLRGRVIRRFRRMLRRYRV